MKISISPIKFRTLCAAIALALLPIRRATACYFEFPSHNHYLFSVFHRDLMFDRFSVEANVFWQKYLRQSDIFWYNDNTREELLATARRRKDTEMVTYLQRLNRFLDASLTYNAWDYPTKARIRQSRVAMQQLLAAARTYKGSRLRAQYELMQMRTLFALKRYPEAMNYWTQTARKLPASVYRDMIQNLYAGCLLRTGHRRQAADIYAAQEDFKSLQFMVSKYRNLDGIRRVYADNPNSPTLLYLVQDFVNNTQETQDIYTKPSPYNAVFEADSDRVNWIKEIGARPIYESEAKRFIAFARGVVAEGRSHTPCLWMAAIGCLEHQMGRYAEAKADLAKALTLDGTPRMKDNARAIYAANSVFTEPLSTTYTHWLTGEMQWLDAMSLRDSCDTVVTSNHYLDVKERMVYLGLVPRCQREGQQPLALAMLNMMNDEMPWTDNRYRWPNATAADDRLACNGDYQGEYFDAIDTITAAQLQAYTAFLSKEPTDAFEHYVWQRSYRNADYYNDLLGTHLMAQGQFLEAIPYLEKLPLAFLNRQNIAPYAALRRFDKDRWFEKQRIADSLLDVRYKLTTNPKLDFCRRILSVQDLYQNMRPSEDRMEKAYELASLYFQASYAGDCWWLTQYGVSVVQDSIKPGQANFLQRAVDLLEESAGSARPDLQQKSLYALAFIPLDRWYRDGWDEATQQWYDLRNLYPLPHSRQYQALSTLWDYAQAHPTTVAPYVSRCDVLKCFSTVVTTLKPMALR